MLDFIAPVIALLISGYFVYNCVKHVISRKKEHELNKRYISRDK